MDGSSISSHHHLESTLQHQIRQGSAFGRSETAIHDIKYAPDTSDHLLWRSSADGSIQLADLRSNTGAAEVRASSGVFCLSIDSGNRYLAAGTELAKNVEGEEEAPIYIWDLRELAKPLTKFTDAHSDDVTQVQYHPSSPWLCTGGTDGLVNLFHLDTLEEDDALQFVIKTESVSKIGFFGPSSNYLFAHTHIETLGLYNSEGDPLKEFGDVRREQTEHFPGLDYIIRCVYDESEQRLFAFSGDRSGNLCIHNVGMDGFEPIHALSAGHTDIIRDIVWNRQNNYLVSGGEDGMLCLWK
ncbi:WD repeat-containing protein 89 [Phlyctochytrium planicorne]|nr:WD repeat-containing protein 89 [Phlyctochytrium planicorne]